MKLSTLAVFGAGYVLGTRSGRERYDKFRALAQRVAQEFDGSDVQHRLQDISKRLETYSREGTFDSSGDGRRAPTRT